ncbi:MAG: hypothetical protein MK165_04215 [Pirellulaceae bacterium]|nr:hypothetical protein [Pirellulaceae bacterium]
MKNALVILALTAFASPAVADEGLLSQLGLQDLQVVSQEEATEVRGLGYVYATGDAETFIDLDPFNKFDIFQDASGDSYMELYLQGLSNLEGVVGASNSITVDFSQSEFDTDNMFDFAGSVSVSAGAMVGGSAD